MGSLGQFSISLAVKDLAASRAFYEQALAPLGHAVVAVIPPERSPSGGTAVLFGIGGEPEFVIADNERPGEGNHIAFRAEDDAAQEAMAERLRREHGLDVTEQRDRQYFRSIYFREPGGVLFEIATDAPGFSVDEPTDALGTALKLPPFLEPHRGRIEAVLPKVA